MPDVAIITPQVLKTYVQALSTLAEFRRLFSRELDAATIAELYVAEKLGLQFSSVINQPGFDLQSPTGLRYQVKHRTAGTVNVDLQNFTFDFLMLVNLDSNYGCAGLWQMSVATAREVCVWREKFRKYQVTQTKFKKNAEAL